MADYDPAAATDYAELENGDEPQLDLQDDEDDDYDPSLGFGGDDTAQATDSPIVPAAKPRTVGPFEIDDDEDDEEEQQESAAAPQTYVNGTESAHAPEATAPVTAPAQDIPLASEPSQEDSTAVLSAIAQQSAPLNGSSSLVLPTSVTDDASNPASTDVQMQTSQDSVPSISAPVTAPEEGKQQAQAVLPTALSAMQSATATPQPPPNAVAVPPAQAAESVPQTPTTQRLPHDKVGQLEDRIKQDPKADTEAWRSLIQHYREKGQLDNARKVYERFLEVFPTAVCTLISPTSEWACFTSMFLVTSKLQRWYIPVRFRTDIFQASIWTEYAALELSQENKPGAESIFQRTLLKIPSLDIWKQYLDYLRRIHPLIPDPDGSKRAIISQAFDVLLDNVGIDPDSGEIWRDYIDFIKSMPGVVGGQGWQDAQKVDLLRKAYHRAVRYPHSELTKLWKEYDHFEVGINKQMSRKFMQDHSPNYMTARTAKTQLDQKIEGLDRRSLPVLPPLYGCAGEDAFATQVEKWRAWLQWEKEDPLVLKDEDVEAYRRRVVFVYRQATIYLRFYPEIWFEASAWCSEQGTEEMDNLSEEFLNSGIEACPESVLLTLKKADRAESNLESGSTDEVAIKNGETLDPIYEKLLTALYALHKKLVERMNKSLAEVKEYFASLPSEEDEAMNGSGEDDDDSQDEKPLSRAQKMEEQLKSVRTASVAHQDTLKKTISYVWVAKLRAFRRIQGQGQPGKPKKGFRGVFAEARPRGQLTSEVYTANALMEWRCYQDKSADKIFERGLKLFPTDEIFTLEYIKHLISNNDDTNARAVFETTMTKISNLASISEQQKKDKSRLLLGYMHTFESNYGDLDKIHKIEKRLRDMFPSEPDVATFAKRFALPSFDALSVQLVISPTQAQPKTAVEAQQAAAAIVSQAVPSIEEPGKSPPSRLELGPHGPYVASPKRGLEDSDNDTPARKFMRAESPLKGAAGRRMNPQQAAPPVPPGSSSGAGGGGFVTKTFVPGQTGGPPVAAAHHPAPLPYPLHDLLNKLPAARFYTVNHFDAARMVELVNGVDLSRARAGYRG